MPERFSVRNTWLTQDQPPTHIPNVQKYLERQPSDNPSPDEHTGEHSACFKGAPTHETLVYEMPVFEGADLDVVQPEQAQEGYVITFNNTLSTNEPSNTTEQSVRFADDILCHPPHEPDLKIPKIANLENSGLRISGRSRKPTQRDKESNDSTF